MDYNLHAGAKTSVFSRLWDLEITVERNGHVGYRSEMCYCACAPAWPAEVHLLQPCRGQGSVLCLETVKSIHTSQTTNWTLGLKRAWSQYGLPRVSAAFKSWFEDWCCWANYQFAMQRIWIWNCWQRKLEQCNVNGVCIISASFSSWLSFRGFHTHPTFTLMAAYLSIKSALLSLIHTPLVEPSGVVHFVLWNAARVIHQTADRPISGRATPPEVGYGLALKLSVSRHNQRVM